MKLEATSQQCFAELSLQDTTVRCSQKDYCPSDSIVWLPFWSDITISSTIGVQVRIPAMPRTSQ
eukprot:3784411-Amphidinium_carterae.1